MKRLLKLMGLLILTVALNGCIFPPPGGGGPGGGPGGFHFQPSNG